VFYSYYFIISIVFHLALSRPSSLYLIFLIHRSKAIAGQKQHDDIDMTITSSTMKSSPAKLNKGKQQNNKTAQIITKKSQKRK
jgi:hypothetical protein